MYSILLVEDEEKILEGIYSIIDSSDIGFGRIDKAHHGREALEMYHKSPYDVILSDIRMPEMDGLELMHHLREEGVGAKVIFVTAFSEFDYVLQALRLGAANFITKPINKAELIESIKDVLEDMPQQKNLSRDTEDVRDRKALLNYFLKRWTAGDMDNLESTMRASMTNVNLFLAEYNVVMFQPLCSEAEEMADNIAERLRKRWEVWQYQEQQIYILILGGRDVNAKNIGEELSEYLDEEARCKRWFCIVGFSVRRYQEVCMTYRLSMKMLNYPNSYMIGALCKASQNVLPPISGKCGVSGEELLEAEDDQCAISILGQIGANKHLLFQPIVGMLHLLEDRYFQNREDTNRILIELLQAWDRKEDTISAARQAVLEARQLWRVRKEAMSPVITRILGMIAEQYSGPMTLKELGKVMNVHPNYLGYLFRKETGKFFSDYINEVRIRKAEEMLINTSESIADIARQVGYGDVRYFGQAFKIRNGMTPGKYRLLSKSSETDADNPKGEV